MLEIQGELPVNFEISAKGVSVVILAILPESIVVTGVQGVQNT